MDISLSPPKQQKSSAGLLTFLPLLYVAWADDILSPSEIKLINDVIDAQKWLSKSDKKVLANWLNPKNPPSAREMQYWATVIRQKAENFESENKQTLVDLSMHLAQFDVNSATFNEASEALAYVENALGILSNEAYKFIVNKQVRPKPIANTKGASFNTKNMQLLLDDKHAALKKR